MAKDVTQVSECTRSQVWEPKSDKSHRFKKIKRHSTSLTYCDLRNPFAIYLVLVTALSSMCLRESSSDFCFWMIHATQEPGQWLLSVLDRSHARVFGRSLSASNIYLEQFLLVTSTNPCEEWHFGQAIVSSSAANVNLDMEE